jgi:hypothetical protein
MTSFDPTSASRAHGSPHILIKAFALDERQKAKDAYDIHFVLRIRRRLRRLPRRLPSRTPASAGVWANRVQLDIGLRFIDKPPPIPRDRQEPVAQPAALRRLTTFPPPRAYCPNACSTIV